MLKQYISSLLLLPLLVGCSISHTERIKGELGRNFDVQTYNNAGGEDKSKYRYETFCTAIKEKRMNTEQLNDKAIKTFSHLDDLRLVQAEIELADKDCN